ncbi:MAG TPA: ROK family protein [Lachnospiraceae bacterium]|nr:ROK family protein [Lachnospiraceae bacterium]
MRIGALEAGGTKMVVAVGNEQGEILDRLSIPTQTPDITMPQLVAYFKEKGIDALGIGCFGPIDLNRESDTYGYITSTPKLAWKNYNIVGAFRKELIVPIGFDTDVNAAAIGEATWGIAQGVRNSIYITIGTGVGVGVIIDGKPLHGMLHPEAGHILLSRHPKDTFQGSCPYHDSCLEGMAAGPALEKRYGRKAYELADQKEVWELEGYYIAQALVNYILTLSPQRIVLGGGVMHQEHLMPIIQKEVLRLLNGYIITPELQEIEKYIVLPALNDNQGILGCVKLALYEAEAKNKIPTISE